MMLRATYHAATTARYTSTWRLPRHTLLVWLCAGLASLFAEIATATEVVVFWQRGCPHCRAEIDFLRRLTAYDASLQVRYFEVRGAANRALYRDTLELLDVERLGLPLTVIGTRAIVGYRDDASSGAELAALIAECSRARCSNPLTPLIAAGGANDDEALALADAVRSRSPPLDGETALSGEASTAPATRPDRAGPSQTIRLPWIGETDLSAWPLPLVTVTLAAIDGFNPCAMWVLVFLLGLLLGQHDPLRRCLLGGTFLLVTALVYYVVIAAWLNVVLAFGLMPIVRIAVGLFALAGGAYYAYGYWRSGAALCRVTNAAQRQRLMARLRAAVAEPRLLAAALVITALAVGVNFVELVCSAGLPAVYTELLAQTPMPWWQYHLWLGLYVLVFLADDLAIFVTAMVTLQVTGAAHRYAHRAQLIGAVVLVLVGVLLIVRPEWLRFG